MESALDFIDQGSVIRGIPLVYAANGARAVMPQSNVLEGGTGGVNLGDTDAMVVTQTCDIRGPGGTKCALLNVAPVYKLSVLNPNMTIADVRRTAYLAHVSGAAFADDTYVVDLRFETAIEKSVVVDQQIDDGFANSEERNEFSKKIGEYRRRGAFDAKIEAVLLDPLEALFNESVAPDDVYEVRVFADPSISRAESVRLIIACEPASDIDNIRGIVSTWYDNQREVDANVNLLPIIVKSTDDLTVTEIRGSVPVYFRHLSGEVPEA